MLRRTLLVSALTVAMFTSAAAAQPPRSDQQAQQRPAQQVPGETGAQQAAARYEVAPVSAPAPSQTSHLLRLDGREIKYTATTGTLPIRLDDGKVAAQMFFVAYTKDGEDRKTRPVSFLYNGGPGSASVWLHMGSFAPKHVKMADEGFQPAPPYQLHGQREHAARRDRPRVRRRDRHRLQPRGRGREQRAVPRPGRRPARLRRVHLLVPVGVQPLAVAEVPDRRELRHHPVSRTVSGVADAPRHRAERHRARVGAAHLPDALARTRQRHRLRHPDRDLRRHRLVSQAAAGRPAAEDRSSRSWTRRARSRSASTCRR